MIRWPLREALRGYRRRVQAMELEDYRHRLLCWSVLAPWLPKHHQNAPQAPAFLRNSHRGHP